ncbi:hypothetical protein J6590_071054 [Homalodisca vitripennis]|nr:hypothetical protein J6590_071054 [Homalodisca vitripennis]
MERENNEPSCCGARRSTRRGAARPIYSRPYLALASPGKDIRSGPVVSPHQTQSLHIDVGAPPSPLILSAGCDHLIMPLHEELVNRNTVIGGPPVIPPGLGGLATKLLPFHRLRAYLSAWGRVQYSTFAERIRFGLGGKIPIRSWRTVTYLFGVNGLLLL